MTRKTHFLIQLIALALQVAPELVPLLPAGTAAAIFHIGITFIQGAVALYAHEFNTDGTPQEAAFRKPEPK